MALGRITRWGLVTGWLLVAFSAMAQVPVLRWRFVGNPAPNNPATPTVANGVIYFPCSNRLYAVQLRDGTLKWRYPADEPPLETSLIVRPLVHEELVYIGTSNGNLSALDRQSGRLRWAFSARSGITASPILAGDTIFFGTGDGKLFALNAKTGDPAWEQPLKVGDYLYGHLVLAEDSIIFASHDNSVYAASRNGKGRWRVRLPSPMYDPQPVYAAAAQNLYLTGGNRLMALHVQSGQVRWQCQFQTDLPYAPAVDEKGVYVLTQENKIYAFDHSGRPLWDSSKAPTIAYTPSAAPVAAHGLLWVTTKRGTLFAYDLQTGLLKWVYTWRPPASSGAGGATRAADYTILNKAPLFTENGFCLVNEDGILSFFALEWVDQLPPEVSEFIPPMGVLTSGQPPLDIAVRLRDDGSGVNPQTIQMLLDGNPLQHEYEISTGQVVAHIRAGDTIKPLEDGRHLLTVIAADWAGNTVNRSWAIYVDNTLRKATSRRGTGLE